MVESGGRIVYPNRPHESCQPSEKIRDRVPDSTPQLKTDIRTLSWSNRGVESGGRNERSNRLHESCQPSEKIRDRVPDSTPQRKTDIRKLSWSNRGVESGGRIDRMTHVSHPKMSAIGYPIRALNSDRTSARCRGRFNQILTQATRNIYTSSTPRFRAPFRGRVSNLV